MKRGSLWRRFRQDRSGATAVEFALIAQVLLLMIYGIVEFGQALYLRNDLSYAASQTSRAILLNPSLTGAQIAQIATDAMVRADTAELEVTVSTETLDGVRHRVVVVSLPYSLSLPLGELSSITLSATSRTPI